MIKQEVLVNTVNRFLSERGYQVDYNLREVRPLCLDSLDYVALILYVERELNFVIDDGVFFTNYLPEEDTITSICERLASAHVL